MTASWNVKWKAPFLLMVITILSTCILTRNLARCDDGTTQKTESAAPIAEMDLSADMTRAQYILKALAGKGRDKAEPNEIDFEKFNSYNDWNVNKKSCKPSDDSDPTGWDECLKATVSINEDGELISFLGFILNCNNNTNDTKDGFSCGCLPDNFPYTDFAKDRVVCMMQNLLEGEECISPWECKGKQHCVFQNTSKSEGNQTKLGKKRVCKGSSSLLSPLFTLIFILSLIPGFRT